MQEGRSQLIAEHKLTQSAVFVTLHNSHINVSNLRLNFDGTVAGFNENSVVASLDIFGKQRSSSLYALPFSLR
jgi:hypothetical protein